MKLRLLSQSAQQTQAIGSWLGELGQAGDWVGLTGELGAGKTCLVQGLALGAGVPDEVPVTSPTYVLQHTYEGRIPVHHLDLYRLKSEDELYELGYQDLIAGDGICAVEWFEQIASAQPDSGLRISLSLIDETSRELSLVGDGKRGRQILTALKTRVPDAMLIPV